jgi:hypothetical protein
MMDVVQMPPKIGTVADGVFPKPPLPKRLPAAIAPLAHGATSNHRPRGHRLDTPPPQPIIRIAFGQREDRTQVLRLHNDRVDPEPPFGSGLLKRVVTLPVR